MDKDKIINKIDNDFQAKIQLDDIPEIDLYMDKVIQLFENKLSSLKRKETDKVLTKTMINNYAKDKLLMSIKNKRYSKEHLILMSLIYELKGGLSISDIKLLLNNIVSKFENKEEYDLRKLYNLFLENNIKDNEVIVKDIKEKINNVNDESFEDKFLLITSMISISNMYRKVGELLIDECLKNRGEIRGIDITKDKQAIEIWVSIEEDSYVYYFFPYNEGVIDIEEELEANNG